MRADLFVYTLNQLRYGAVADELSERLAECVQRAGETGKQAKLTLTLTIKPSGGQGQYEIRDQIKTVLPELDKGLTLMFGTPEGDLTREDPRQQKLELRKVTNDQPENLRKVEG